MITTELKELNVIEKFKNKSQEDIIAYSYFWYPQTAVKSMIKKDIFRRDTILNYLDGELENEYKSIVSKGSTIKESIRESWKC